MQLNGILQLNIKINDIRIEFVGNKYEIKEKLAGGAFVL